MEGGLLDRASPRRGSLTSLHRYSSGSFSHNPKLGSPSNTLQINNGNFYALCKDLDKFTRYFIVKAVQVIVQSRIGDGHKLKAECRPNGNDWFNINISDIVEVSEKTKAVLDAEGLSVKSNWRVCCEISVKTNEGSRVVLEHWIISNKSSLNSNQKLSNSGQASPKSFMANRSLNTTHLTSSNGGGTSLGRDRTATFSNPPRTRLNSIDDCTTSENNYVPSKVAAMTTINNENIDIKPSASCYSLSSAPNTNIHQSEQSNNLIIASPSTESLNTNATATAPANTSTPNHPSAAANATSSSTLQQNQSHQSSTTAASTATTTNKTSASSSIYTIYNRMSLLLKTLLTTAHVVPAYRLATRTSRTDSCVICYRVYTVPRQVSLSRGSIEDINSNLHLHSESPNKRSLASTASLNSVDIREFVDADELEHFCPILKLGSIKTDVSEMEVAVCYRTDIRNSNYMLKNPKSTRDKYNRILDEDCLTAAKQLLAGNECLRDTTFNNNQEHRYRNGSQSSLTTNENNRALDLLDQPLKPAFATIANEATSGDNGVPTDKGGGGGVSSTSNPFNGNNTNGCELIESAFDSLLRKRCLPSEDDLTNIASDAIGGSKQVTTKNGNKAANGNNSKSANAHSEPIQVPKQRSRNQTGESNLTPGSTPKSLTDSYVFVDLNPPFASEEQNDINSFFHGPSPSFSNGSSNLRDVDELTNQLATIEANASQIDDFVDNMCASEDEHEASSED